MASFIRSVMGFPLLATGCYGYGTNIGISVLSSFPEELLPPFTGIKIFPEVLAPPLFLIKSSNY